MSLCTDMTPLALSAGETRRLQDARGAHIECLSGSLWITQYGDRRDIILAPGETFTLDRGGAALLHAFGLSRALLVARRPVSRGTRWWSRAGHALLCHFTRLGMSRAAWRSAYRI